MTNTGKKKKYKTHFFWYFYTLKTKKNWANFKFGSFKKNIQLFYFRGCTASVVIVSFSLLTQWQKVLICSLALQGQTAYGPAAAYCPGVGELGMAVSTLIAGQVPALGDVHFNEQTYLWCHYNIRILRMRIWY